MIFHSLGAGIRILARPPGLPCAVQSGGEDCHSVRNHARIQGDHICMAARPCEHACAG